MAPASNAVDGTPLDRSASTLSVGTPARSSESVRSPPEPLVGRFGTTPLTTTRRLSVASPAASDPSAIGAGSVPGPTTTVPLASGRISSWPYGAASLPVTSTSMPRAGAWTPAGIRTPMPPVASSIVKRRSMPVRPTSAVTVARTTTVAPIDAPRAVATSTGVGAIGVGVGVGVGIAVGVGVGAGIRVGVGVGAAVGVGVGVGVGIGVGVGVTTGAGVGVTVGVGVGVGVGAAIGVGVGVGVGAASRRRRWCGRRNGPRHRRRRHPLRRWHARNHEVRGVVVGVDAVPGRPAG